ncbi:hypothetical protein [Tenacibaculum finnmarkense]|uniref:hypothetical protein n=1 Tax=Tenacibaculum finnmarkense TaxID=2781243 RepID=UPI000C458638|nr:hypothetical protein [Tenacibaculum finnmarkense]MBE7654018.1 hypothetical protein [Tenacibaculum finnmarkense genomovar finnmarkense]MCD8428563.1 hypothetical protein [Tenacibaculum finnmarkense genomovar finnmarkense]MCG8732364.1 hypothetical protein [Tenacibaculum finnmarkense]MCG8753134.1 hypothetical protein [Tenacibaculum finnmarkense]MCG8771344.1 hypothetical protein [Tenacibaculum finnmarkense]
MLDPYELLDKVMEYSKNQFNKGRSNLKKTDLWNYVIEIDPKAKRENLNEVINELDARGWLLDNNETEIKFDPASFQ